MILSQNLRAVYIMCVKVDKYCCIIVRTCCNNRVILQRCLLLCRHIEVGPLQYYCIKSLVHIYKITALT